LGNNEGDQDSRQTGNKDPDGNPSDTKTATKSSGEDNGAADEKLTEAPSLGSTMDGKAAEPQESGNILINIYTTLIVLACDQCGLF